MMEITFVGVWVHGVEIIELRDGIIAFVVSYTIVKLENDQAFLISLPFFPLCAT